MHPSSSASTTPFREIASPGGCMQKLDCAYSREIATCTARTRCAVAFCVAHAERGVHWGLSIRARGSDRYHGHIEARASLACNQDAIS